jgi:hypothetical protein
MGPSVWVHADGATKRLLQGFQWKVIYYPPHTLDLAPSVFHLFPHAKWWIGGQHFGTDKSSELAESTAAAFYDKGIGKLVLRYEKYPPHTLDLAPSVFHLFPHAKWWIGGQHFGTDKCSELAESTAAAFYDKGIGKLVLRYEKYLLWSGDYVEK